MIADPGGVGGGIELSADLQPGAGRGRADAVHDDLVAGQRTAAPVHGDMGNSRCSIVFPRVLLSTPKGSQRKPRPLPWRRMVHFVLAIEERLEAVMVAPLYTLVAADCQARPTQDRVARWELPEADRTALTTWGLPTDQIMMPQIQLDSEPLLIPNVASERERRLIAPDQRLYRLGRLGRHDQTPAIGVVAGDGRIMSIRETPLTADDLHPSLREHYRGLYKPAVDFISSSVAQFVEVTWRWRAAVAVLRDLEEPHHSQPMAEFEAHFARVEACERIVLAGVKAIDPGVNVEDPDATWVEIVTDKG
jgi:hypothetical protein